MRTALVITAVVQSLLALCGQAVTLPFEKDGEPFFSPKMEIVWAVTNPLPATVKVFKVIAAPFSKQALAYLSSIGGAASAKQGTIDLYRPLDSRQSLTNVPTQDRAYQLGSDILAKLEMPASELVTEAGRLKAWYYPGTRTHFDKATRKPITEPNIMGIEFRRALDGIRCYGQQVHFQFESEEKLTQLRVNWHGLKLQKECPVASATEMVGWIKEGRARAQAVETTGSRWIKVADIKKLSIQDVELCYDATPDWKDEERAVEALYPFAVLTAEAEFSTDDRETITLLCPAIKEGLSKPVRETGEFNIYPSTRNEKLSKREESK